MQSAKGNVISTLLHDGIECPLIQIDGTYIAIPLPDQNENMRVSYKNLTRGKGVKVGELKVYEWQKDNSVICHYYEMVDNFHPSDFSQFVHNVYLKFANQN